MTTSIVRSKTNCSSYTITFDTNMIILLGVQYLVQVFATDKCVTCVLQVRLTMLRNNTILKHQK